MCPPRVALLLILLLPLSAVAQPLYKWTDEHGKTHYSNSPQHGKSEAIDAPRIGRENIDERIRTIKQQTPDTCINHGGLDCAKGADSDGSVICLDGYRDAILPFRFECMEARLQGRLSLELAGEEGGAIPLARNNLDRVLKGRVISGYRLDVRNHSGVAATGIAVDIVLGRKQIYRAVGPERIDAYGSAEYSLSLIENGLSPTLAQIEQSEYKVSCTNCGAVMGVQSTQ